MEKVFFLFFSLFTFLYGNVTGKDLKQKIDIFGQMISIVGSLLLKMVS